jgi:signal transduction histidine kinase
MHALADHLKLRRKEILATWRRLASADPMLTSADHLSRLTFYNHIPDTLDVLDQSLRGTSRRSNAAEAAEHGSQRWQQGYALTELVREFTHLHLCLLRETEDFAARLPAGQHHAIAQARELVALAIHDAVTTSIARYSELQQAEAAGRLRALEAAVSGFDASERARGDALRAASHDLRGGLGIVSSSADLLALAGLSDELRDMALHRMRRGLGSLTGMLADLADLSRLEAGQERRQLGRFDAARTLVDLGTAARATAEQKGLYLELSGPDVLEVHGDEGKVRRIAQNLLVNALKYTSEGGVTLTWGVSSPKAWELSITDTGPGLPSASGAPLTRELKAATEAAHEVEGDAPDLPPMRARQVPARPPAESGEGIGLSIVKRLCELLDASLELDSSPGRGTRFRIRFPRALQGR